MDAVLWCVSGCRCGAPSWLAACATTIQYALSPVPCTHIGVTTEGCRPAHQGCPHTGRAWWVACCTCGCLCLLGLLLMHAMLSGLPGDMARSAAAPIS